MSYADVTQLEKLFRQQSPPSSEWPFYFQYSDYLVGIEFHPVVLSWRSLDTTNDLITLLFQLSYAQWLEEIGEVESQHEFALLEYQVPLTFKLRDLPFTHKKKCSDSALKVISFSNCDSIVYDRRRTGYSDGTTSNRHPCV